MHFNVRLAGLIQPVPIRAVASTQIHIVMFSTEESCAPGVHLERRGPDRITHIGALTWDSRVGDRGLDPLTSTV